MNIQYRRKSSSRPAGKGEKISPFPALPGELAKGAKASPFARRKGRGVVIQIDTWIWQQEERRQARRRQREVEDFWQWAPEWMAMTGNSEEELLREFPSFRGTKPGNIEDAPAA